MKSSILFILNSLEVGGSEIKIIKVANALAKSGIDVSLAYLNPPTTTREMIDPAVPVTDLGRRGKYSLRSLRRLSDLVCRDGQKVVAVNPYPLLYVVPVVKWKKLKNVKAIGLVNAIDFEGHERMYARLFALALRQCDRVVFGCAAQRTHWITKYGLAEEKSQVIYNGVDHEFFSPSVAVLEGVAIRKQLGLTDDAFVIGSIGRLSPEKSYDNLVDVTAKLVSAGRNVHTILAGQGSERRELEELSKSRDVGNHVHFLGVMTDVRPALAAMNVFVLPSRFETFSNAALEAMAMARPVVLSETGGAAEMVEHKKSGMLFEVGNVPELSSILSMLHDSESLRCRLGSAARQRVIATFSPSNMIDRYGEMAQAV